MSSSLSEKPLKNRGEHHEDKAVSAKASFEENRIKDIVLKSLDELVSSMPNILTKYMQFLEMPVAHYTETKKAYQEILIGEILTDYTSIYNSVVKYMYSTDITAEKIPEGNRQGPDIHKICSIVLLVMARFSLFKFDKNRYATDAQASQDCGIMRFKDVNNTFLSPDAKLIEIILGKLFAFLMTAKGYQQNGSQALMNKIKGDKEIMTVQYPIGYKEHFFQLLNYYVEKKTEDISHVFVFAHIMYFLEEHTKKKLGLAVSPTDS